jgi:hypothetical protein
MIPLNRFILEVARITGQQTHTLPRSLDQLLRTLIDRLYRTVTRKHMSMSLVRPAFYPHIKAKALFGYSPQITLTEGFERINRWYSASQAGPSLDRQLTSDDRCHA